MTSDSTAAKHSKPDNDNNDQLQLAQNAAAGDADARAVVNKIAHAMISYQTDRFCKRFCRENQYLYQCTLPSSWGSPPQQASLCEWGNASYAWMLEDLTNEKRLLRFEAKHGACLGDYLYRIANSLPFYERWKDWRFGRKVHVPTYIQDIDPHAAKAFLALRSGDSISNIAQKIAQSEDYTETLCHKIIVLLTQKNRLHLLDPPKTVSLTDLNHGSDDEDRSGVADLPSHDPDFETEQAKKLLQQAWQHLDAVEQYVLEAMLIDELDANDVLIALKKLDISIKDGVTPADLNRQHLYYFRRKTLAKLAKLMNYE
ncbi:hypothetical protein [Kaarinaea lacus]